MSESFLSGFEIRLICLFARFEPGDVLRGGDSVSGGAVLTAVLVAASFHEAFSEEAWSWGGGHADNVGEGAGDVFFVVVMSVAAALAVVLFGAFRADGAEGGEGFVVVDGWDGRCGDAGLVAAVGS